MKGLEIGRFWKDSIFYNIKDSEKDSKKDIIKMYFQISES